ncbi:MAG: hypothetical protein LBH61_06410 [Dysgonamonadaceae bacterium]|jgi:hypothetical protein|nr:hypothetical protein [Dysgonamonadaceae bacterium]
MATTKNPLFPIKIADQVADVNSKQEYLVSVAERLSISDTRLSELAEKVAKVNADYAKASNRETRSQLDTAELAFALKDCHQLLRRIIDYSVKYNRSQHVRPEDFEALNVYRYSGREPLPEPTHSPRLAKGSSRDNIVTLSFVNPLNGKRGKPSGCASFEVAYRLGGERPLHIAELSERINTSSSPIHIPFSLDQENQLLFFAVRYIGTRGDFGPWSEINKVMVTR